jgi:hypothetical protein
LARSPLPLLQSPSRAWHFCTNLGENFVAELNFVAGSGGQTGSRLTWWARVVGIWTSRSGDLLEEINAGVLA